jgi:D-xylose 1-dehydrogenase (NADP+, D-xylono-1,5-lactone-forming)
MAPEPHVVRWGVIGCGNIARHAVCPAINWAGGATLQAVASREGARASGLAGTLGAASCHGSYEELLADPAVDAVYIGLPNGLHEKWTLRCLEAGKHVLCEKSLALTLGEARTMGEAARARGLRLMEAYMYRHHPQWETIRALLRDGRVGEPRFLRAGLMGDLTGDPTNHRWSPTLGGGALFDVTCYGINVVRYLLGAEPLAVTAWGDMACEGVDRSTGAILDFGGGVSAQVHGSLVHFGHQFCEIVGTRGRIIVESPFIPGWEPTRIHLRDAGGDETFVAPGANHYLHMIEHFGLCMQDASRPLEPGEIGIPQAAVLQSIQQSITQGRRMDVPR